MPNDLQNDYASLFTFARYFGGFESCLCCGELRVVVCPLPSSTKGYPVRPDANAMQKRVWKGFAPENETNE